MLMFLGRVSGSAAAALFRVATLPQMAAALATAPLRAVISRRRSSTPRGRNAELRRDLYRWTAIATAIGTPAAVVGPVPAALADPGDLRRCHQGAVPAARSLSSSRGRRSPCRGPRTRGDIGRPAGCRARSPA